MSFRRKISKVLRYVVLFITIFAVVCILAIDLIFNLLGINFRPGERNGQYLREIAKNKAETDTYVDHYVDDYDVNARDPDVQKIIDKLEKSEYFE